MHPWLQRCGFQHFIGHFQLPSILHHTQEALTCSFFFPSLSPPPQLRTSSLEQSWVIQQKEQRCSSSGALSATPSKPYVHPGICAKKITDITMRLVVHPSSSGTVVFPCACAFVLICDAVVLQMWPKVWDTKCHTKSRSNASSSSFFPRN